MAAEQTAEDVLAVMRTHAKRWYVKFESSRRGTARRMSEDAFASYAALRDCLRECGDTTPASKGAVEYIARVHAALAREAGSDA